MSSLRRTIPCLLLALGLVLTAGLIPAQAAAGDELKMSARSNCDQHRFIATVKGPEEQIDKVTWRVNGKKVRVQRAPNIPTGYRFRAWPGRYPYREGKRYRVKALVRFVDESALVSIRLRARFWHCHPRDWHDGRR